MPEPILNKAIVKRPIINAQKNLIFLGGISFAMAGTSLCAIFMFAPTMLMSPPVLIAHGVGFVLIPVVFKALSSMIIQAALHDTWSLIYYSAMFFIMFGIALVLSVRSAITKIGLSGDAIPKLKNCLMKICFEQSKHLSL